MRCYSYTQFETFFMRHQVYHTSQTVQRLCR